MSWKSLMKDFERLLVDASGGESFDPVDDASAQIVVAPDVFEAERVSDVNLSLWPAENFRPGEVACKCCGRVKTVTEALIKLQDLREMIGKPLRINSGYRCPIHNARVGGAPRSQHKRGTAFDISTSGWTGDERAELVAAAYSAGFTGFGGYNSFLHVDIGRRRQWGQKWAWPGKE